MYAVKTGSFGKNFNLSRVLRISYQDLPGMANMHVGTFIHLQIRVRCFQDSSDTLKMKISTLYCTAYR